MLEEATMHRLIKRAIAIAALIAALAALTSVAAALAAPGDLDPSFDGDGAKGIDSGGTEYAGAVALQPNGKIVVAGSTSVNNDAVVYRLQGDPPGGGQLRRAAPASG
jgi:beta-propeller uncharacterized protein DUF5122